MVVRNLEKIEHLQQAAKEVGVQVLIRSTGKQRDGRFWARFVLRPIGDKYRLIRRRRVWAVCLHGHTEFMRVLFQLSPNAVIKSCMATVTKDNLDSHFWILRYKNVGSILMPDYYGFCCNC